MEGKKWSLQLGGRELVIETGVFAKQASGAVTARRLACVAAAALLVLPPPPPSLLNNAIKNSWLYSTTWDSTTLKPTSVRS